MYNLIVYNVHVLDKILFASLSVHCVYACKCACQFWSLFKASLFACMCLFVCQCLSVCVSPPPLSRRPPSAPKKEHLRTYDSASKATRASSCDSCSRPTLSAVSPCVPSPQSKVNGNT